MSRYGHHFGRDKASARKRGRVRLAKKLSASRGQAKIHREGHKFLAAGLRAGLSKKEITRLWRARLKRNKSRPTRKGKRMATRTLPKELIELARALREASAKPSEAKRSSIQRKMESLIRQIRAAQKQASRRSSAEREAEDIRRQADEWASKGPSGDPSRRKRSGYQKFVKAFAKKHKGKRNVLSAAARAWRGLSASSKAKWGGSSSRKKAHGRRKKTTHRRSAARRHRARRHTARRGRRAHRPY